MARELRVGAVTSKQDKDSAPATDEFGGLIGVGVDATSGALNDLTPNPLVVVLAPATHEAAAAAAAEAERARAAGVAPQAQP